MPAPNGIRGAGAERRKLPVQRSLRPASAAVGALSPGRHKDLLPGWPAGADAGAGTGRGQTLAGEPPAAAPGGPGSPREHPQVPTGESTCSPALPGPCLQPCPSPRGWERWGAAQIRPWGGPAHSHVGVELVGAERSPTGEPRGGLLSRTPSVGQKEEEPVPGPARPQPGLTG